MKRFKLICVVISILIVGVMLVVCESENLEKEDGESGEEYDFDGSEVWEKKLVVADGFYHIGNDLIEVNSQIYLASASKIGCYVVDEIIEVDLRKILSLSLLYEYSVESFTNEFGSWLRFKPFRRYINEEVVKNVINNMGIEIESEFYEFINEKSITTGYTYESSVWYLDNWYIKREPYSGKELRGRVPKCIFSEDDLLELVNEYIILPSSEESKFSFIEEITEGFFAENKSGVVLFNKIWKILNRETKEFKADLFWRKDELNSIYEFNLLESINLMDIPGTVETDIYIMYTGVSSELRGKLSSDVQRTRLSFINDKLVVGYTTAIIK